MLKLPISSVPITSSLLESTAFGVLRIGHMIWGERTAVGNAGHTFLDDRVGGDVPCSELRCSLTASACGTFLDVLLLKLVPPVCIVDNFYHSQHVCRANLDNLAPWTGTQSSYVVLHI